MNWNSQTLCLVSMVGLVVGGATLSAGADLIDCQMPANEAAWYAAAGSGVTNLAFDHDMSVIGNYYWDSHGIRFGATGGGFGPSAGYDVGFYTPAGWSLLFHEPHGYDTRDLRLTFATPQRAISFNNIAWTNMEPAPSGGSGPPHLHSHRVLLSGHADWVVGTEPRMV